MTFGQNMQNFRPIHGRISEKCWQKRSESHCVLRTRWTSNLADRYGDTRKLLREWVEIALCPYNRSFETLGWFTDIRKVFRVSVKITLLPWNRTQSEWKVRPLRLEESCRNRSESHNDQPIKHVGRWTDLTIPEKCWQNRSKSHFDFRISLAIL